MKNKVEILTLSFDGYSDIWPLHYDSIEKYWSDCPFKLNLLTNKLKYERANINSLLVGEDCDWSQSVLKALSKVQSEYILFFYDDFIFKKNINTEEVLKFVDLTIDSDFDYFRLRPRPIPDLKVNSSYGQLSKDALYRVSLCCSIVKKEVLIDLLKSGESAWEFELYGTHRSRNLQKFYSTYDHLFFYHNAIVKGKWVSSVKNILEKNHIDPQIRGWYDDNKPSLTKRVKGFIFSKLVPGSLRNYILDYYSKK